MTPDETAEQVLDGVLGHKNMTFVDFRQAMIDQHPEYLDDNEIHGLYMKHVVNYVPPGTNPAVEQALEWLDGQPAVVIDGTWAKRDDLRESLKEMRDGDYVVRVPKPQPQPEWRSTTLGDIADSIGKKMRAALSIARGDQPRSRDDA